MKKTLEDRGKLLYEEVCSLCVDFNKKRKVYEKGKNRIQLLVVLSGALTSLALGLSFLDQIALLCQVAGLILSVVSTVLTGVLHVYNYEQKWKQRSVTYLKLLELKRDMKLGDMDTEEEFEQCKARLSVIMKEDTAIWIESIENKPKDEKQDE